MVNEFEAKTLLQHKILVIDHDPESLEILMEPLKWEGYDFQGVNSLSDASALIETWQPHLVLMEWMGSGKEALQLLTKIKDQPSYIACLFVSSNSDTDDIIDALDAGADDYIIKPFVPLEMLARIRSHLRIRDLNEKLTFANARLKELVDTDDLTGLFNMRSLFQKLDLELERARRFHRSVCVVMIDMDHFKSVNDGHDHLFGSFVISEFGKIIKNNTRNIDIPARYGGDEFLIVLTETNHDGALYFCERLRKVVESWVFTNGNDSMQLTLSLGFAISEPGEKVLGKELVRRADWALYEAKDLGRNRVCFFTPEIDQKHAGKKQIRG